MKNKIAIVTGGGSGIGRSTAIELAKQGVTVVIADRDEYGADKTCGSILQDGGDCLLYTSPSPRDKRQSRMPSSA